MSTEFSNFAIRVQNLQCKLNFKSAKIRENHHRTNDHHHAKTCLLRYDQHLSQPTCQRDLNFAYVYKNVKNILNHLVSEEQKALLRQHGWQCSLILTFVVPHI